MRGWRTRRRPARRIVKLPNPPCRDVLPSVPVPLADPCEGGSTPSVMRTLHPLRVPPYRLVVLALLLGLLWTGCDEATLGPTLRGSIDGRVLTFDGRAPIAGVSITTSPATGAIVTENDGTFRLRDVPSGPYNITARKSGFQSNTLSVAVRDDETTPATLFLERDDEASRSDSLTAEIINWNNRSVSSDSSFVDVEYRVRNVGTVPVASYEVYIRIATDGEVFFQEESGDALDAGQADIGTFSKFLRGRTAQAITVEDLYFEPADNN